jgi:hypothetical protein
VNTGYVYPEEVSEVLRGTPGEVTEEVRADKAITGIGQVATGDTARPPESRSTKSGPLQRRKIGPDPEYRTVPWELR